MFRALFSVNPKWVQKGQKILQKGINDMSVRYKQQAFIHNIYFLEIIIELDTKMGALFSTLFAL